MSRVSRDALLELFPSAGTPIEVLEREIVRASAAGRAAWSGVELDDLTFARYLASRLPENDDPIAALSALHVEDLYLACACAEGHPRALAALDQHLRHEIEGYLSSVERRVAPDDVAQCVREKLLMATSTRSPRILEYTGRGALGAWLRTVCVRTAIDLRRAAPKEPPAELAVEDAPVGDPAVDFLRARCMVEFREAFEVTVAALDTDERNVLRMHYLEGITPERIAVSYRVHRTTVTRWLESTREKLLAETRKRLAARLKLRSDEIDSFLGLLHSRFDVSLSQLMKEPER